MDWKKIKKEYIAGDISYRKLAEKHGVSFSTLEKTARREGWRELKRQADEKSAAKAVEAVSSRNAAYEDAMDELLDAFCRTVKSQEVWSAGAMKDLTIAAKNIKDIKGYRSELDIEEQRARIEALRARAPNSCEGSEEGGIIVLNDVDECEEVLNGT